MPEDKRLTLSINEAARVLGISQMSAYKAARSGDLPSIKMGRRLLVPRVALEKILNVGNDRQC